VSAVHYPSHEIREHTSEIELHIRAESLSDILAEAGRALATVQLAGANCVPGGAARSIQVSGEDRELLLVNWLNELIFLADLDHWVASEFEIDSITDTEAHARASGLTLEWGASRVKAATLHGLRVENVAGGLEANIILDI
jgi:SHS2 domain-containing protein